MRTVGLFILLVVMIITLTNIAAIVQRQNGIPDIFSRLFPEQFVDEEEITALETGVAPFADPGEGEAQTVELVPGVVYDPLGGAGSVTEKLDIVHANEGAVSEWVSMAVTEALTFTLAGYADHRAGLAAFMNANAVAEYGNFLETTRILGLMRTNDFEVRTFPGNVPFLRTHGAIGGRYRWVYDVPVSMTFLPIGATSYEELEEDQYQFEELTIRVQIGRTPPGVGRDGLAVETWEALRQAREE